MTTSLALPTTMDIHQAEPLRNGLLALRGQSVTLDASAVDRLGGLCLQVLLSAQRTWVGDGQVLSFGAVSEAFETQWNAFGAPAIEQGDAA